jgi:hypothetical protein
MVNLGTHAAMFEPSAANEALAVAQRLVVVARYRDRDALLAAAARREFDVILLEDISRLWPSEPERAAGAATLERLGIACVTCRGDDTRRDGWPRVLYLARTLAQEAVHESRASRLARMLSTAS